MTFRSKSSNWLRWDEAAKVYEALARREPGLLLYRGTKWCVTIEDVVLYCWIAYYANLT